MRQATRPVGTLCAVFAALAAYVSTAAAAQPRVAVSSAVSMPAGAHVTGRLAEGRRIELAVGLTPRDSLALHSYAQAVSTPGSRDYGRTLSVRQFARRFGASQAHVQAVADALRAEGLSVDRIYADHLTIFASGSAKAVEHAFATRLNAIRLADGRRTWIQDAQPTLPADVAGDVASVAGLDGAEADQPGYVLPRHRAGVPRRTATATGGPASTDARSHAIAHTTSPAPCAAATSETTANQPDTGTSGSFGYTANTIAAAYGFTSLFAAGDYGQGQTIDVFETETLDPVDVNAFQACYGTAAPVDYTPVGTPDPIDSGLDGDTEAALDVDNLIGLAPAATIDVYEGSPEQAGVDQDILSAMFSADTGKIVSISYGSCEAAMDGDASQVDYEDTLFEEAAIQGQTVFAAAGDSGSEECITPSSGTTEDGTVSATDYATQPLVTGVGGTTLYQGSGTSLAAWNGSGTPSEGVWNDGPSDDSGGGGGISSFWKMPSYQSGAAAGLGVINAQSSPTPCTASAGDCRETPDVSADANPGSGYVIYANSENSQAKADSLPQGWGVVGGTSASTPVWAAIAADADAQAACRGLTLGAANGLIYDVAGVNYAANFRDITLGDPFTGLTNTDVSGLGMGDWPVTTGYDMATGLGVPNVGSLAPALCAARAPTYTVTIPNPGTLTARVGRYFSYAIDPTDSGGAALSVSVTGLPAGLIYLPQDNEIYGKPTTRGTATVTVSAADGDANSATQSFTLHVVTGAPAKAGSTTKRLVPAALSHYSLRGVAKRRPRLTFTITRARGQAKLRTITLTVPKGFTVAADARGVKIVAAKPGKFTVRAHQQTLTIKLKKAEKAVRITVGRPTLKVTGKVARRVRRGRTRKISFTFGATTTKKKSGSSTVKIKVAK